MQEMVKQNPVRVYSSEGASVYEYLQPFEHDDEIMLTYAFYMVDDRLARLDYYFDGKKDTSYLFSEFSSNEPDAATFAIPGDYQREDFDYAWTGDTVPPWFE
jgi:hypothetical protein